MIFYKRFKEEKTGAISRPGSDLAGDAYREQVSYKNCKEYGLLGEKVDKQYTYVTN